MTITPIMELTADDRLFIAASLRYAADRYRDQANVLVCTGRNDAIAQYRAQAERAYSLAHRMECALPPLS